MSYLSPLAFARAPLAWPRALAARRAHWSAAPDFAFALAAKRAREAAEVCASCRAIVRIRRVPQPTM